MRMEELAQVMYNVANLIMSNVWLDATGRWGMFSLVSPVSGDRSERDRE